ncbi:hypothetical protein EYF80_052418 [Liparis tanakae]|uniref:Uncharacterized protein n=1 Tax=Liparis tanakae TaxID=230148 RepID=A0A4Z2F9F0_9TELE|nr:hypothetical protein EYF80_052418 [Liparis tanakae]
MTPVMTSPSCEVERRQAEQPADGVALGPVLLRQEQAEAFGAVVRRAPGGPGGVDLGVREVYNDFLVVGEQAGEVSEGEAVLGGLLEARVLLPRVVGQFDKVAQHVGLHRHAAHHAMPVQDLYAENKEVNINSPVFNVAV